MGQKLLYITLAFQFDIIAVNFTPNPDYLDRIVFKLHSMKTQYCLSVYWWLIGGSKGATELNRLLSCSQSSFS